MILEKFNSPLIHLESSSTLLPLFGFQNGWAEFSKKKKNQTSVKPDMVYSSR